MTEDNLENCMIFRVKATELMLKWGDYINREIIVQSPHEKRWIDNIFFLIQENRIKTNPKQDQIKT